MALDLTAIATTTSLVALNFTGISNSSLLGSALRLPLRLIPPSTVVPILQGPLRGLKWITGSANHGAWLGSYERPEQLAIAATLQPGTRFWDLGAHVGLYSLLAARLCGPENVLAVEPLPSNLAYLRRHLALNNMSQVTVLESAVSRQPGELRFQEEANTSMGHLTNGPGSRSVRVCSLDSLLASGIFPPDVIKCDIEGEEFEALQGARHLLREHRPKIFLSFHESESQLACCLLLREFGYQLIPQDDAPPEDTGTILAIPLPRPR